jgi:hypothetical protein
MATSRPKKPRIAETQHPLLFEINVRLLLSRLRTTMSPTATLNDVPDAQLDEWRDAGYDAVWLMGVWQTGEMSRQIARTHEGLQEEYRKVLPDVVPEDIQGSPYSVESYHVPASWGGDDALQALRRRLARRGLSLILDFVCNHTARDHAWVKEHPEFYIHGLPGDDERRPDIFFKTDTMQGERVLAFGRDPTFPGWTDTAQLNHLCIPGRQALIGELRRIATQCDGVRCDMAMLLLNSVYLLTWGDALRNSPCQEQIMTEFWTAAVTEVRREHPHFLFIAEAYWNLEWELQQRGFNFTYDKVLYDRLLREGAGAVRDHLRAEHNFQIRSLRFIENHDEMRASRAFSSVAWQYAAAVIISTVPGMAMFHDGQEKAARYRLPIQLVREPDEQPVEEVRTFYRRLLRAVSHRVFREGEWAMLPLKNAWHDNWTWQNYLVFWWSGGGDSRMIVVNYAPHSSQCYVEMPVDKLDGLAFEFSDLMSEVTYVRDKTGLGARGMYFDLPAYGFHIFEVRKIR